jgi:hypothetical protein
VTPSFHVNYEARGRQKDESKYKERKSLENREAVFKLFVFEFGSGDSLANHLTQFELFARPGKPDQGKKLLARKARAMSVRMPTL